MNISEAFVQLLKDRADIESVVSSYVQLKRKGRTLWGLCPFHSEKTPSFTVSPDNGLFHCFGCGAGGDVITFIRKMENLDYPEAVQLLCERTGLALPEEDSEQAGVSRLRQRIYEINRAAARFFHNCLLSSEGTPGLTYLRQRGLTDNTIRHFGLGYAPNQWNALHRHLHSMGYSDQELVTAKVAAVGKKGLPFDLFRGRVMFPIIDLRGNVVAFGARALGDEQPKYLNTGDTPVFKKSRNLFALNFAKGQKSSYLILCEGYMDVIALHQAGFRMAVATLGTALTPEQARILTQYTSEVLLSYDADAAGQKATKRASAILDQVGLQIRVLKVENAKDPDEFIKKFGPARFKALLEKSQNAVDYQLSSLKNGLDLDTQEGKLAYLRAAAKVVAGLQSPLERDLYAGRLSEEYGMAKTALVTAIEAGRKKALREKKREEEHQLISPPRQPNRPVNPQRAANQQAAQCEDALLMALYRNPDYYPWMKEQLQPQDFATDLGRRIYVAMCDALSQHRAIDPLALSALFNNDEMGEITALIWKSAQLSYSAQETQEIIHRLKQFRTEKTDAELLGMDPTDIQSYLKGRKNTL